jgi:hypothetical protein
MRIQFEQACQILDTAFSPLSCQCERNGNGTFDLVIFETDPAVPSLALVDIPPTRLDSIRAVSQLVLEVRQHLTVETMRRRMGQAATA